MSFHFNTEVDLKDKNIIQSNQNNSIKKNQKNININNKDITKIDPRIKNLKPCKPGETHNPNGRPIGSKNYSTRIKELLIGISEDDGEWTSPLAAEKVKIIFAKNKKGKYIYPVHERQRAIDSILDRVEGGIKQKVDYTGEVSGNIIINHSNK